MPTSKFAPKTKPIFPIAQKSERLQRVIRSHKDLNFSYELNHTKDRAEVLFDLYAQKEKFKPLIRSKLMTFCRVRMTEPNMFELDDKGILDSNHKIKEALVWSESKKIMDPDNPITNALVQATIVHGATQDLLPHWSLTSSETQLTDQKLLVIGTSSPSYWR